MIPSYAANLMQIYNEALTSDPKFLQAYNKYKGQAEALPQAVSSLLPHINGTSFIARSKQVPTIPELNNTLAFPNEPIDYNSAQFSITLTQAIFNYQSWAQIQQAAASVKQAQAEFNAAAQDLIVRVVTSYFAVLNASEILAYTIQNKNANARLLDQSQKQFKVGIATITSVYEAQAAYDAAVAQEQEDRGTLLARIVDLRRLTNRLYLELNPLDDKRLPLIPPKPNYEPAWEKIATQQNYAFLASRYAVKAARKNIQVKAAGALPTLNLQLNVSNANNSDSSAINPPVFAGKTQSVSLALNFPAYQGGLVLSQTRQAKYNFKETSQLMEETYRDALVKTQTSFILINNGIVKIKADRESVQSAQNSVTSTEKQLIVGTRTVIDVVTEQQRLYARQVKLSNDKFTYITSVITLKQASGILSPMDVYLLNKWLTRYGKKITSINELVEGLK